MPNSPRRPCPHPGCGNLVVSGKCDEHATQERREYDSGRKDDPYHRFYSSAKWRKVRAQYKQLHPLCERCEAIGVYRSMHDVHHKNELRDGGSPYDFGNLESLCRECHSQHSAKSGKRWKR